MSADPQAALNGWAMVGLVASVIIIWGAGASMVARHLPHFAPGRWAVALGYGYFVGVFGVALSLLLFERILGRWEIGLSVLALALVLLLVGAFGRGSSRRAPANLAQHGTACEQSLWRAGWGQLDLVWKGVTLLVLALVALRLGGLLLEGVLRPVFAWDAWYSWSYRARGFFEYGAVDAFVSRRESLQGVDGYGQGYRHPPLVSVIQLWPALVLGEWHETRVNLPWWLALPALGLALFGQLRRCGLGVLPGVAAVYLLVSVPLLGLHMGLGGYADLWLTAAFGMGALSGVLWLRERRWLDLILFVGALVIMIFLKQAGILFSLPLLLAMVLALWRPATSLIVGTAMTVILGGVIVFWGVQIHLPGLGAVILDRGTIDLPRTRELFFDPQWHLFLHRLLLGGSWNLLFVMAALLVVVGMPAAWSEPASRFLWTLVVMVLLLAFFAYSSTTQIQGLIEGTGFGRHLLPLAPVLVFWVFIFIERSGRSRGHA